MHQSSFHGLLWAIVEGSLAIDFGNRFCNDLQHWLLEISCGNHFQQLILAIAKSVHQKPISVLILSIAHASLVITFGNFY